MARLTASRVHHKAILDIVLELCSFEELIVEHSLVELIVEHSLLQCAGIVLGCIPLHS